jgi:hypothetical protein
VRVEDPPANSMASFKFISVVLSEGTTLIFGSWDCIAAGAHRGADRHDRWVNLKDLFININPLKVADCYFVHMHRQIDSSSDPSTNGYIDLNYSARLHLVLQRRCTATADLDDPVQLRLVPQCPRAAATSSTTSILRGRSMARRRLHQLLVST